MPSISIEGKRVTVGDEFLSMSPEQQNAAVDEIAQTIGIKKFGWSDTWPAKLAQSIYGAVKLPGEVMRGETQVFDASGKVSDEVIERSFDLAGVGSPIGAAARSGLAKTAIKAAAPTPGQSAAMAGRRLGVDLPRAVTSDRTTVQQIGKAVTSVPFGGSPLRKASQGAIQQLDDAATRVQSTYGAGDTLKAGEAMREGITQTAKVGLPGRVAAKYDAVDELVDPAVKTVLHSTRNAAIQITSKRSASAMAGKSQAIELIRQAAGRPEGLTYEGIKNLRTSIGELLKKPNLMPSDISESELKQIYSALSDDLRSAVGRAGGTKALSRFEHANTYAAKVAQETQSLNKILGSQSDEALVQKLAAMAGSTAKADSRMLFRARMAVSPKTWDEVSSAVLANMGRDATGAFTPDRFVTAWGKMSEAGKNTLFGSTGKKDLVKSLNDIAAVSTRMKSLNQFANPSGTAQHLNAAMMGGGAAAGLLEPMTLAATAAGVTGTRLLSTLLSKPKSAKAMAQWVKAYEAAVTNPKVSTRAFFANRSKTLSLTIANDIGAPQLAGQIGDKLLGGLVKGVAEREEPQGPEQGQPIPEHRPGQKHGDVSTAENSEESQAKPVVAHGLNLDAVTEPVQSADIRGRASSTLHQIPPSTEYSEDYTGMVVPYHVDGETGERSLAVPRALSGAWDEAVDAVTAPGEALSGRFDLPPLDAPGITEDDAGNVYRDGKLLGNRVANERALLDRGIGMAGVVTGSGAGLTASQGARLATNPSVLRMAGGIGKFQPRKIQKGTKRYKETRDGEFVQFSDGSIDFGKIDLDDGLGAIPIRIRHGKHNYETDGGVGDVHIEIRHGDQIRSIVDANGKPLFRDVAEYVEFVSENWTEILDNGRGRPVLVVRNAALKASDNTQQSLIVSLEKPTSGNYYDVQTAGPYKNRSLKKFRLIKAR